MDRIWLDILLLGFNFAAIVIAASVLISLVKGAPPVPTSSQTIGDMVRLVQARNAAKAVDLGSGDGRIVIALAKEGIEAHGFEINPLLVWWTRYKIRRAGLKGKAFAHWRNFWKENLAGFDAVIIYGLPNIMSALEKKLQKELRVQSIVISNYFPLPNRTSVSSIGTIYVYTF